MTLLKLVQVEFDDVMTVKCCSVIDSFFLQAIWGCTEDKTWLWQCQRGCPWKVLLNWFWLIMLKRGEGGSIIRIFAARPSVCRLSICLIEHHLKLVLTRRNNVTFFSCTLFPVFQVQLDSAARWCDPVQKGQVLACLGNYHYITIIIIKL